jgi:hypothetical protein
VNKRTAWILYAAFVVLYVLHNDWWFWYDPSIVLGLPIGLTYHVGYSIAAALLMLLFVRFAWPSHLEVIEEPAAEIGLPEGSDRAAAHAAGAQQANGGEATGGDR